MTRIPAHALAAVALVALLAVGSAAPATADSISGSFPIAEGAAHLVVTPDGSTAVVISLSMGLSTVDTASGAQTAAVMLGGSVYNLAMSPDGATAVAPATDGTLSFVQVATGVVSTVALGTYFFDAAFTPDGTQLYVTTGSNSIVVVDVASRSIARTIVTDPSVGAYGIAATPDGAGLVLADPMGGRLVEVSTASGAVSRFTTASTPTEVVVSPNGALVYSSSFASGELRVLELSTGFTSAIALGGTGPVGDIAFTPDGSRLYVPRGFGNQIDIIHAASGTVLAPLVTGVDSRGIAISADSTTAFASDVSTPALLVIAVDQAPRLALTAPTAALGSPYAFAAVTGGSPAPTSVLTGTLPQGLSFDASTGRISGTPTEVGVFPFSIIATNSQGSANQSYSLTVSAALADSGVEAMPVAVVAAALLVLGLALRRPRRVH